MVAILESLNWLGFKIDGPIVFQSKNIKNHLEVAESLISNGLAYKCFHDDSYITEKKMSKQKFISEWRDGKKQKSNKPYVIRIKAPLNGNYTLKDEVQGKIVVNFNELDDYIIVRTDKTPTFLLSSVVDDVEMKISDIIRGDDHLTNTFRQKIIFEIHHGIETEGRVVQFLLKLSRFLNFRNVVKIVAITKGITPRIKEIAVIKTARNLRRAAIKAASRIVSPASRFSLANSTIRIAVFEAKPKSRTIPT